MDTEMIDIWISEVRRRAVSLSELWIYWCKFQGLAPARPVDCKGTLDMNTILCASP